MGKPCKNCLSVIMELLISNPQKNITKSNPITAYQPTERVRGNSDSKNLTKRKQNYSSGI